mmetsp:Transcript_50527/g.145656  ORF Transcript_50527/g.145656 Transcript_50527/m.145656 type:complete len:302 (-) Transcript_50527:2027-2932(-)
MRGVGRAPHHEHCVTANEQAAGNEPDDADRLQQRAILAIPRYRADIVSRSKVPEADIAHPKEGMTDGNNAHSGEEIAQRHCSRHVRERNRSGHPDLAFPVVEPLQVNVLRHGSCEQTRVLGHLILDGPTHCGPQHQCLDAGDQQHKVGCALPYVPFIPLVIEAPRQRKRRDVYDDGHRADLALNQREPQHASENRGGPIRACHQDDDFAEGEARLPHNVLDSADKRLVDADRLAHEVVIPQVLANQFLLQCASAQLQHPTDADAEGGAQPKAARLAPLLLAFACDQDATKRIDRCARHRWQ